MPSKAVFCSIIIPVLNDTASLKKLLINLQPLRKENYQIIVVDGGSQDRLKHADYKLLDHFIDGPTGRAKQMNAGAAMASGELLWFLHADSVIDVNNTHVDLAKLNASNFVWGRFDVRLTGDDWRLGIVSSLMNWRSAISGISTGDQGICIRRSTFKAIQAYPDIPIMEDIAISKKLIGISKPLRMRTYLLTSGRRWLDHGFFKTVLLMWFMRLAYFLGVSPKRLSEFYKPCTSNEML